MFSSLFSCCFRVIFLLFLSFTVVSAVLLSFSVSLSFFVTFVGFCCLLFFVAISSMDDSF